MAESPRTGAGGGAAEATSAAPARACRFGGTPHFRGARGARTGSRSGAPAGAVAPTRDPRLAREDPARRLDAAKQPVEPDTEDQRRCREQPDRREVVQREMDGRILRPRL